MRLIIVRHGQTEYNVKNIVQGQSGNPLDETGREQARKAGERLSAEKIDVAYSSDLNRARMTCEAIMKHHPGIPVHYVKELREMDMGTFVDGPKEAYNQHKRKSGLSKLEYRPPGGESHRDMRERVIPFLEGIKEGHRGQTVLIVTHGGIKRILMGELMGKTVEEYSKEKWGNTSVSIVNVTRKGHEVMVYNCTKHLSEKPGQM